MVDTLRSHRLPTRSKLQCVAAALEHHPDALAASTHSADLHTTDTPSLVELCCHAALEALCAEASKQVKSAELPASPAPESAVPPAAEAVAETSAEAGELVTGVSGRTAVAVHSWSRNQLTNTAVSQLQAVFQQHWQQLQQAWAAGGHDAAAAVESGQAGKLWPTAEAAVLAQLRKLGASVCTVEQSSAAPLWQDLQTALDIAVLHLGWEWAYYQVSCDACWWSSFACVMYAKCGKALKADRLRSRIGVCNPMVYVYS